jgi:hypothetical protein
MGYLAVTIPAKAVLEFMVKAVGLRFQFGISDQGGMAPDAILLHYIYTCLVDKDILWLKPKRKHGCVACPIHSLKIIGAKNIVLWHMAIVATGYLTVRAVLPGGILGSHDMAIDTGFWRIGQIGKCTARIGRINDQAGNCPEQYHHRNAPLQWWNQPFDQFLHPGLVLGNKVFNFLNYCTNLGQQIISGKILSKNRH